MKTSAKDFITVGNNMLLWDNSFEEGHRYLVSIEFYFNSELDGKHFCFKSVALSQRNTKKPMKWLVLFKTWYSWFGV